MAIGEHPNYYSVIPANVRYDGDLSASAKLMYGEITALTSKTGECWATNTYFMNLYGVTEGSVKNWIRQLKDKGYISVTVTDNRRIITVGGGQKIDWGGSKKLPPEGSKNLPQNNTRERILKENNKYIAEVAEIIDYLNDWTGKNYRSTSASTKHIRARLDEGYTVEDAKKVIDIKVAEWKGTDMEKYLRPETLFGNKFDGYLNQPEVKRKEGHKWGTVL